MNEPSMFHQRHSNEEKIQEQDASSKRVSGAGRKPLLGAVQKMLTTGIDELRILKTKVTRGFVADRAQQLAEEHDIALKVTHR